MVGNKLSGSTNNNKVRKIAKITNEILRKLNNLLEEQEDKAGMVYFMTELAYFNGKLKL